ncbi:MAG: SPOR domain-containing protein [Clostridia bacterium]|nr:SPOR domain-containing protein [Clostridia bacterium]
MEIRHVKRTARRKRAGRFSPAMIPVLAVFFIGAYLIGASRFGTWLASDVVAPAILDAAPLPSGETQAAASEATAAPEASGAPETLVLSLPALYCYSIQIGAYESLSNAEAQAAQLKKLGAAGYIVDDGSVRRVLAAGYPRQDSMAQVIRQLEAEGLESRAYELCADGFRLRVSGTPEQLECLEAALSFSASLPERLSEASIQFDRDSMSVSEGVSMLARIREECADQAGALEALAEGADEALRPALAYLGEAESLLSVFCDASHAERAAASSDIKRLYLETFFLYQAMAASMQQS